MTDKTHGNTGKRNRALGDETMSTFSFRAPAADITALDAIAAADPSVKNRGDLIRRLIQEFITREGPAVGADRDMG